jgi:dodecin
MLDARPLGEQAPGSFNADMKGRHMAESVYRFTEVVGTSSESWEQAAAVAVETAAKTLRDLRVAEVTQLDLVIQDGRVAAYRAKISISFKLEQGD